MLASPPSQNPIWCIKCCEENNEESLIRAKAFCKYRLWGKVIWSCSFVSEKPLKQCTICSCLVGAGRDLFRQKLLTLSATNFPLFPCKPLLRAEVAMPCTPGQPPHPAAHPSFPPALLRWGHDEELIVRLPATFRWGAGNVSELNGVRSTCSCHRELNSHLWQHQRGKGKEPLLHFMQF